MSDLSFASHKWSVTEETHISTTDEILNPNPVTRLMTEPFYDQADIPDEDIGKGQPSMEGEFGPIKFVIELMYQYFGSGLFVELAQAYAIYTVYVAAVTMVIFFTKLSDFILGSEFAITVSFEFVQWTIVWVHHRTIEIALDRYESGPRKLFRLYMKISGFALKYRTYIQKVDPPQLSNDEKHYFFTIPMDMMKVMAILTHRIFLSSPDLIIYTVDEDVSTRIKKWNYTPDDKISIIQQCLTTVRGVVSDMGQRKMVEDFERNSLNENLDAINDLIETSYEDQNVKSPDIYENFFMFAMLVYLLSFFLFTTYRNCQQFTPLIAPVIAAFVFGPFVINKVLGDPFSKDTIFKGNLFELWRQWCITRLQREKIIIEKIYNERPTNPLAYMDISDEVIRDFNNLVYINRNIQRVRSTRKDL
ncbi:MAG: hypothetical protein JSS82_12560 [Bacteroidetes bacterium]|nr:hypothetical protein [Bacteroidota bacterium]